MRERFQPIFDCHGTGMMGKRGKKRVNREWELGGIRRMTLLEGKNKIASPKARE